MRYIATALVFGFACAAPGAFAQQVDSAEPAAPALAPQETQVPDFDASLTVYLWAVSLDGDATIRGADLSVDAQFVDVVGEADTLFGLMGALDMRFNKLVFQIHPTWMRVGVDGKSGAAQGVPLSADVETDTLWFEGFAGWRFMDREIDGADSGKRFYLDGFVGGRVTYLETDLRLTTNAPVTLPDGTPIPVGAGASVSDSEAWFDPFIGARIHVDLTRTFGLGLRADIGGFGIGSEFAWQAGAFVNWKFDLFGADAALILGYRALGQDYQDGLFAWDIIAHGPVVGLNIRF